MMNKAGQRQKRLFIKYIMFITLCISVFAFATFLTACGKLTPPEPQLESVTITNRDALIAEWYTADGVRTVEYTLMPVSFTSENTNVSIVSSDTSIVSVNGNKLHPVKAGTAKITVSAGGKSDTVDVTVKGLDAVTISNKAALTADWWVGDVDRTVELAFAPNKYNAENTSVKIESNAPEVVKVDNGKLKAVGKGTATITVTADGKTATQLVTVKAVNSITITNKTSLEADMVNTLPSGSEERTVEFTVNVDEDDTFDTSKISITSSDEELVEVVGNKIKRPAGGKLSGTATITVEGGGAKATFSVKVREPYGPSTFTFGDDFIALGDNSYAVKLTERTVKGAAIPMPTVLGANGTDDKSDDVTVSCETADIVVANNKFGNSVAVGAYTLKYSVTDDKIEVNDAPVNDDIHTVEKTATLYVYRELFAEDSTEVRLNNNFEFAASDDLDVTMINNQTVTLLNGGITDVTFNAQAGKVYYAEAEFSLALGLDGSGEENIFADISVGLSHKADGKPVYFAAVDRDQRDAYTGEYTKANGIKEYDPAKNYGTVYAHPYVLKIDKTRKTDTGSAKTVKIAVMRDNNYFYLFVDDKYVMCSNRPEYAEIDTVPALFGKNIKQSNGDSLAQKITLLSGTDATAKLTALLGEGKQNIMSGYAYNQGSNGSACIADGNMDVSYDANNGITVNYKKADGDENTAKMGSYMYFYGDFTFSFVYKTKTAQANSSMYVSAFPMSFDNMSYTNQLFELGVKYASANDANPSLLLTRSHCTNSASTAENHPLIVGNTDKTLMQFDHSQGIRYTVKRHVFADHAQYTLNVQSVANDSQRATRSFAWAWTKEDERLRYDAPVMLVFRNIAITGTYSNISWDDGEVTSDYSVQDTSSVTGEEWIGLGKNNNYDPVSGFVPGDVSVHTAEASANPSTGKYKVVIEYSADNSSDAYGAAIHIGFGQEYKNQEYLFEVPLDHTDGGKKYIVLDIDLGRQYTKGWGDTLFITCKPYGSSVNDVWRPSVKIFKIAMYQQSTQTA